MLGERAAQGAPADSLGALGKALGQSGLIQREHGEALRSQPAPHRFAGVHGLRPSQAIGVLANDQHAGAESSEGPQAPENLAEKSEDQENVPAEDPATSQKSAFDCPVPLGP